MIEHTHFFLLVGAIHSFYVIASAGNVNCNSAARKELVSDDVYQADWPDFQGNLFPYMSKQMCGETCQGQNNCTFNVGFGDTKLRLSMEYPAGGNSPCSQENWNDIFDLCWFGDIPRTGGVWVDGDTKLEMTFEKLPEEPLFSDIIHAPENDNTEASCFWVSDFIYTPPGTRGGPLPPEYGVTVTGVRFDDCSQIGENYDRFSANVVSWKGPRASVVSPFRDVSGDNAW
jgi:hypothetical protein